MKTTVVCLSLLFAMGVQAQQQAVPRVTYFNGVVTSAAGKPQTGTVGITFALYEEQQGGAALWSETQNVPLDEQGRFTVLLGSVRPEGLPLDLFASGKARWLGVEPQMAGAAEQPRVLLVGVPYALKAADADTLGGLPASAFLTAAAAGAAQPAGGAVAHADAVAAVSPNTACSSVTSDGTATANEIAYFTTACNVEGSSTIVEKSGNVGIGTASPATTLEVKGSTTMDGVLKMTTTGAATASAGADSNPIGFGAAAWDSGTSTSVPQQFQWEAEPVGNDSASPSAAMNLLYASGTATPQNTGFSIGSNGVVSFVTGQTFPGTGTITGVTASSGLTGGGTSGSVSVGLATCSAGGQVLQWNGSAWACAGVAGTGANSFTGNQTVTGSITASGEVQGSVVNAGASLDINGVPEIQDNSVRSFSAGSGGMPSSTTGAENTAVGDGALHSDVAGGAGDNTGIGYEALYNDNAGADNAASGAFAMLSNTTGSNNTANGAEALYGNTSGSYNTAVGFNAGACGPGCATGNENSSGSNNTFIGASANLGAASQLTNATAIGANAAVSASNSLVLGSISGVNGATANTSVGIGTTAPGAALEVNGTAKFDGLITFASGQTFPGSGSGTVTSVSAGTGLAASPNPITSSGTLSIDTTKVPLLASANSFTGSQTTNGQWISTAATGTAPLQVTSATQVANLNASLLGGTAASGFATLGANTFSGTQAINANLALPNTNTSGTQGFISLGGAAFLHDYGPLDTEYKAPANVFLGAYAGNFSMTGAYNTGIGEVTLIGNTTGQANTAVGAYSMASYNYGGSYNTATGFYALYLNNGANDNTATGAYALSYNTGGSYNTATGASALYSNDASNNTATGYQALYSNDASNNTATGYQAMYSNTTGSLNTAAGVSALYSNTTGGNNTAEGYDALNLNQTGYFNAAFGAYALANTTGGSNTAVGDAALQNATTGSNNVAIGTQTFQNATTGSNNIAIGAQAGINVTTGSNNIEIGNNGQSTDSGVIYIGQAPNQTSTYIAGITGVNVSGAVVYVTSSGQLGVKSSSRRYKEDIHDMGDASDGLFRLRPVTFRYKRPFADGSKPVEFGLIAEEVAEVYPDMVVRSADGQIETVKYQDLAPMLLNEVQKQKEEIRSLEERLARVEAALENSHK